MKRFGVLLFFVIFFQLVFIVSASAQVEQIAAERIKNLYSKAHIFDCREYKTSYDEGHVKSAIYFDIKAWSNDKSGYVEKHLSGIQKKHLIFYSSEDRMIKPDGTEFNYTGYYASDVSEFISILPLYKDFTFYRVSEDIIPWLIQNSDWSETTNNPPPVGSLLPPPSQMPIDMSAIAIIIIIIIGGVVGIGIYIKRKLPARSFDQDKAINRQKDILTDLSNTLNDHSEKSVEFKIRRRR